jgi:hypothetical protein
MGAVCAGYKYEPSGLCGQRSPRTCSMTTSAWSTLQGASGAGCRADDGNWMFAVAAQTYWRYIGLEAPLSSWAGLLA